MSKVWTKNITVEDREFRLTFWRGIGDLLWTRIEEKVLVRGWFGKVREDYALIRDEYWTDENPVEKALHEIKKYLNNEKEEKEIEKLLDKFCSQWYN